MYNLAEMLGCQVIALPSTKQIVFSLFVCMFVISTTSCFTFNKISKRLIALFSDFLFIESGYPGISIYRCPYEVMQYPYTQLISLQSECGIVHYLFYLAAMFMHLYEQFLFYDIISIVLI